MITMKKEPTELERVDNKNESPLEEPIFDLWDPKFTEEQFQKNAEFGLEQLEGLDDSQQVILDHFPGEG